MKTLGDPFQFVKAVHNGVPIYWQKTSGKKGFVHARINVGVGARFDPVGKEGLAHAREHIGFQGSWGWRTRARIHGASKAFLMESLYADTSFERMQYSFRALNRKVRGAMGFVSDFLFHPVIDPESVKKELNVIVREFWNGCGSPKQKESRQEVRKLIYGDHTFGRMDTPLGWPETIMSISADDLKSLQHSSHVNGALTLIVTGDVNDEAIDAFRMIAEAAPQGKGFPKPELMKACPSPREGKLFISRLKETESPARSENTSIRIHRIFPLPEGYRLLGFASQMLTHVLSNEIREKMGATYGVHVSANALRDHATAVISLTTDPKKESAVCDAISRSLEGLGKTSESHKDLLESLRVTALEHLECVDMRASEVAEHAAHDLAMGREIRSLPEMRVQIEKVTYQDIVGLFSGELAPEKLLWVIRRP